MKTVALGIAGVMCLLIPIDYMTKFEKILVFMAVWFLIYTLTPDYQSMWKNEEQEKRREQFHIMLRRTTLPGKYHTLKTR